MSSNTEENYSVQVNEQDPLLVISLTLSTLKELEIATVSEAFQGDFSLQELHGVENQGRPGWSFLNFKIISKTNFSSLYDTW